MPLPRNPVLGQLHPGPLLSLNTLIEHHGKGWTIHGGGGGGEPGMAAIFDQGGPIFICYGPSGGTIFDGEPSMV